MTHHGPHYEIGCPGCELDADLPTGTCDWGDCDRIAVATRWSEVLGEWLAVCETHQPAFLPIPCRNPPEETSVTATNTYTAEQVIASIRAQVTPPHKSVIDLNTDEAIMLLAAWDETAEVDIADARLLDDAYGVLTTAGRPDCAVLVQRLSDQIRSITPVGWEDIDAGYYRAVQGGDTDD